MTSHATHPDPLDWSTVIRPGRSINAGSSSSSGEPSLVRVLACRRDSASGTLTLLVMRSQAEAFLADVASTGRVAAVFSDPPTHRTIQAKGRDGRVLPPEPGDAALVMEFVEAFAAVLEPRGFRPEFTRAVFHVEPDDLVSVAFTPETAFDQTPGPQAGRPWTARA